MPPDFRASLVYDFTLQPRDPLPLVRGWNRLEGRPRSADFHRSLRAEVRDPLWFLTRQWQYGEFEGEDAGSPIDARIAYRTSVLDTYEAGGVQIPYDAATPLEVFVEREPIPFDLMLHMQLARVFQRELAASGHGARLRDYLALFPLHYETTIAGVHSEDARAMFDMARPFVFDTARLVAAVRGGSHAAEIAGFSNLTSAELNDLVNAGSELVAWFDRMYAQAGVEPAAWRPETLEYRFECRGDGGSLRLSADAHRGGDLEWHAFDVAASTISGTTNPATVLSFLPTAIRFSGMPNARFWEMEDGRTDFGRLDVESNDVAKLLMAEFLLLYSNDWCLVPLELPIGSWTRIDGLLVTDVFGDQFIVRPADKTGTGDWSRFSMFRLDGDLTAPMGLWLAPSLMASMESPPIESVEFLRDEMANMVWAIEQRVPSRLGEPVSPEVREATPESRGVGEGVTARFTLGTTAPGNWRPFVPAHVPGSARSIRLQRARMPGQPLQPVSEILRTPGPYFVAEEEVPRAGRTVTRAFQRARWTNGATFLWIGRRAVIGRGEGSSGLVFDQIDEIRSS